MAGKPGRPALPEKSKRTAYANLRESTHALIREIARSEDRTITATVDRAVREYARRHGIGIPAETDKGLARKSLAS